MTRNSLGLPDDWLTVEKWFRRPFFFGVPLSTAIARKEIDSRWSNIEDFSKPAPEGFWKNFPHRKLPEKATTKLDIKALKQELYEINSILTAHEIKQGAVTVDNLENGAPAHQMFHLKGDIMKNAPSATSAGPEFTGILATWIEKEIVAGPFLSPPPQRIPVKQFDDNRTKR